MTKTMLSNVLRTLTMTLMVLAIADAMKSSQAGNGEKSEKVCTTCPYGFLFLVQIGGKDIGGKVSRREKVYRCDKCGEQFDPAYMKSSQAGNGTQGSGQSSEPVTPVGTPRTRKRHSFSTSRKKTPPPQKEKPEPEKSEKTSCFKHIPHFDSIAQCQAYAQERVVAPASKQIPILDSKAQCFAYAQKPSQFQAYAQERVTLMKCPTCKGSGKVNSLNFFKGFKKECKTCQGKGEVDTPPISWNWPHKETRRRMGSKSLQTLHKIMQTIDEQA
jgi:hypothetical protein